MKIKTPIFVILLIALASLAFTNSAPVREGGGVPIDSTTLSSLAGALLSLIFSYAPGARNWYGGLSAEWKRAVMLVMLALVAGGAYILGCAGYLDALGCDKAGFVAVLKVFVSALVANQAMFLISPTKQA